MTRTTALVLAGALLVTAGVATLVWAADEAAATRQDDIELAHARKTVRMLDDIYKSAVILITEHYVTEESDLPAGSAAKALFAMVKEKGWHDVRLLDASGEPLNDENSPSDAFEKEAVQRLLKGENYVDKVENNQGQRRLRAATPIPVVMQKCIMCHDNYRGLPEGKPIGALGYTIPLD